MRALLLVAVVLAGCADLDGFLYNPRQVDGYDWDAPDPERDGELSDPRPSLVGPDDRFEGFVRAAGEDIHYVFARRPGATTTILYSHGNSHHLGFYWDRVERLWALGHHVLIYDYPGYGRSTGSPDEQGVYASAQAAYELLPTLPEVDPARVFVYGYSLGGAPSYELAARAARGDIAPVRGVITEATFCSVQALVSDGAFVDVPRSYVTTQEMDNCGKAAGLAVPIVILHGAADDFVVPRHAHMLKDAAPAATLHLVPGADHGDIPLVAGADYDAWIRAVTGE